MTTHATGTFEVKSWDEETYVESDGGKLTRAHITQAFAGDIEGDGAIECLMCYRNDGTANVIGLQRVVGRVGERSGSFVLQATGTFDGREARSTWFVVPGSGTDELRGLRGEGESVASGGPGGSVTLDYDFE